MTLACGADVQRWLAARDVLADRPYLHSVNEPDAAPNANATIRAVDVLDVCPYPGLAPFGSNQGKWFFGREQVTAAILGLLTERLAGSGPLMVAGPSGTGKSSLLRAGLLSALRMGRLPGSRNWEQCVFTPTADPLSEFAAQLADCVPDRVPADRRDVISALLSNAGYVADVLWGRSDVDNDNAEHSVRAILIVDQFEEVFTLCPNEQHRTAFIRALYAIASGLGGAPPAPVVLGMRADFYGSCASYPELIETLRHGQVLLGAMNDAEVRDAVEKPAHSVGLGLEPGLVEVMMTDLSVDGFAAAGESVYQPGALPLLAHALFATWQQRDGRVLTIAGYRLIGGITGAVAATAERTYQRLDPDRREVVRTVLLRMIQFGDDAADTRRRVDRALLVEESMDPAGVETVLNALVAARLVTMHETTVEVVHEALLRAWPRLRAWIDNDRAGLLLEQRFGQAAEAWSHDGRHDSDLYRGPRLAAVQERLDTARSELPTLATEFLNASAEHERVEQQGVLRRARRLRWLVAVLGCLVLLAGAATGLALVAQNDIHSRRAIITSQNVAGAAIGLRSSNPGLATQLALTALKIARTAEARGALMSTLVNLDRARRADSDSDGPVSTVAFSHRGGLLVAGSLNKSARVWAVDDPPSLLTLPIASLPHPDQVLSAVFDPTDRFLATAGSDGMVRLWSVEGLGQRSEPFMQVPGPKGENGKPLAFSHGGTLLATGSTSGTSVRLWDVTDPTKQIPEFDRCQDGILAVAFSTDGRMLATACADGTIKLWDISDRAMPVELWARDRHAGMVYSVAFSPDDHLLATGYQDDTATLWDIQNRREPQEFVLGGHLGGVAGVAFSPDGNLLATASYDNSARLWDISNPANPVVWAMPLAGDNDNVYSVAFQPGGHTLVTSSYSNAVRLWEIDMDRAATEVCEMAFPTITREEWNRYLPGYDYAPPCPQVDFGQDRETLPGSTTLVALHSGKCVGLRNSMAKAGAFSYQLQCIGAAAVKWNLERDTVPGPGGGAA